MASEQMWGGLPFIVPSGTAMKYLYHAKVINEEDVPVGAHYRAREDMLNNVRFPFCLEIHHCWLEHVRNSKKNARTSRKYF